MDQPKRVEYLKPKIIFLLWVDASESPLGFSNFKKLLQYVADQSLWPADVMSRYDKILRQLRAKGRYSIYHLNQSVRVTTCSMHGSFVKSSKRSS